MSLFAYGTVSGAQNGTNTTFTVVNTSGGNITTLEFYSNGVLQTSGIDITVSPLGTSTATVSTSLAPASTDTLVAWIWQQ